MITKNSATGQWLDAVMKSYKKNDPGIVEKSIMALTLLEQLSVEGLDFIYQEVGTRSLLKVPVRHRVIETAPPDVLVTARGAS